MRRVWTQEMIDFLRNNYVTFSHKKIGKRFGLTETAVRHKLSRLKLRKRSPLSEETLQELFVNQRLSTAQIAKMYGVHQTAIAFRITKFGIKRQGGNRSKLPRGLTKPSKEILIKLYWDDNLTIRQIADMSGISKKLVLNWFKEYAISRRDNSRAQLKDKNTKLPTKEELEKDHTILSLKLIAKKYNISVQAVTTIYKKYELKPRNMTEARKLAFEQNRVLLWNKGLNKNDMRVARNVETLHKVRWGENREKYNTKLSTTQKRQHAEGKRKVWNKGKKLSQEHKKKVSEAKKKLVTPEYRAKMREIGLKAKPSHNRNTKPEKMMRELLIKEGLTKGLKEQFSLIFGDLGTKPDFAYPEHKLAIYCDGEYWHGGFYYLGKKDSDISEGPRKENILRTRKKDAKQHAVLWKNGWMPLRFWQHEIEQKPDWVIEQVKKNLFDADHIKKREEQRKQLIMPKG